MNRKGTLSLMEQSVMLLVFAVAAALCLKGFLTAELIARENEALDNAVVCARNVAEQMKHTKGEWNGPVAYDENWQPTDGAGTWRVTVTQVDTGVESLGRAEVTVTDGAGNPLFSIPAAWQEVDTCEG